jgi:colicin import membrane protein
VEKSLPRLNPKNTKEEMIKAYNELVQRFQEKSSAQPEKKAEVARAAESALVEKTASYTVESIIKNLADLNINLGKGLASLGEELTAEAAKLAEIRQAIAIENKKLEELHDIDVAANTLEQLIQEHASRKTAFETEMDETEAHFEEEMAAKKADWKKEQDAYVAAQKEAEARLKKDRDREKEEYEYTLALARRKEKDQYEAQKAALQKALKEERQAQEQELAARETAVAAQEEESAQLQKQVEAFPPQLNTAVEQARREVQQAADAKAKQEGLLTAKEAEGEKKVSALKIAALEEMVARQNVQVEALTRKLEEANTQVQAIAVKAIEGASNARALSTINEIAMEQAKNLSGKR